MAYQQPQENNVLPPVVIRDFSAGIHTNISSGLVSPNILKYSENVYNNQKNTKLGTLKSRHGIDAFWGSPGTGTVKGFGTYADEKMLVGLYNIGTPDQLYVKAWNGSSWNSIGGAPYNWINFVSAGADWDVTVRFEYFVNYVFATAYFVENDPSFLYGTTDASVRTWNGNVGTNWGTTNLTGLDLTLPVGVDYIAQFKEFNGRLYAIKCISNRALFSSLPDSANNITWNPSVDYIDFGSGAKDQLTAMEVNGSVLIFFKERSMYTWNGEVTQSTPLYNVGAISPEVIQTISGNTIFASYSKEKLSIYLYNGSEPQDISSPIREILDMSTSLGGSWKDEENYYLSLGSITIDNTTFDNLIICYNVIQKAWSFMNINKSTISFGAELLSRADVYGKSTRIPVIIGDLNTDTSGKQNSPAIWDYSSNTQDEDGNGVQKSINILLQTNEEEFGSRATIKQLNKFFIYASGNYGIIDVAVRIDGGNWIDLGKLSDRTTEFELATQGHYFEFRLSGSNTGEPFVFEGFEFPSITVEPYET